MGKQEKALSVLSKYHANGETDDPLVQWELHEIESALLQEASARSSYLDFFRTPGNLRRLAVILTISVGTNWVGNSLISYYLAPILRSVGITSALKITSINAGLGAWNLIVAVSAGLNVERFGRRPLFLTSFIGMFCSYAIVMGLSATFATSGNTTAGLAVIPFLFIFYGTSPLARRLPASSNCGRLQVSTTSLSTLCPILTLPKSFHSHSVLKAWRCLSACKTWLSHSINS
jgi:hypothetical protein